SRMNRRDSGDMVTGHGSRVAFLGVFLLLTSGCAAAGAYSATSAGPPKPIREVLPNGVVLIVQEHRASDVVAVQLWLPLGGLYEVAYSPHPYGRQILGTHEFIERLRRDRLLAFYRKYFVPKNMVVVVIGAVKPAEVRSAVAAAFGKIPSRPGGRPELPPPPAI